MRLIATVLALTLVLGTVPGAWAQGAPADTQAEAVGPTPPRLSYMNGETSFWRPGAQDWAPAQINTPLAPGDDLYTSHDANLELEIGGRAFVRAWGDTRIALENHDPDFVQFKVTSGHVALDLRSIEPGRTVEIDTPHAAFIVERPGYYRFDVTQSGSLFIARRGGQATMTPAGGQATPIGPNQEIVLEGWPTATVMSHPAPALDVWDRWNNTRTEYLVASVSASARHVPAGVYGASDLDQHGTWQAVPTYGSVWVPRGVPVGWAPYTTGRWIADPYYGWTWVDTAPWGWAPYHYGRWVYMNGFWAWAPGPVVVRPVYAPALVAFFAAPGVRVSIGTPFVSWVALGWGEPLVPWWGRSGFVGRPSWVGWGGPRVVNNVVVDRRTVVNVNQVNVYRNVNVQNAVVAVREDQFGRGAVQRARGSDVDTQRLEPVRGPLHVRPDAASFVASNERATRPPDATLSRPVVATRRPMVTRPPDRATPEQIVPAPAPSERATRERGAPNPPGFGRGAPSPSVASPQPAPSAGAPQPAPGVAAPPPAGSRERAPDPPGFERGRSGPDRANAPGPGRGPERGAPERAPNVASPQPAPGVASPQQPGAERATRERGAPNPPGLGRGAERGGPDRPAPSVASPQPGGPVPQPAAPERPQRVPPSQRSAPERPTSPPERAAPAVPAPPPPAAPPAVAPQQPRPGAQGPRQAPGGVAVERERPSRPQHFERAGRREPAPAVEQRPAVRPPEAVRGPRHAPADQPAGRVGPARGESRGDSAPSERHEPGRRG